MFIQLLIYMRFWNISNKPECGAGEFFPHWLADGHSGVGQNVDIYCTWVYIRGLLVMLKELLAGIWSSLQPPWLIAKHWKCCNEWRPSYSSQHIRCMMNASHAYSGIVHAAIFIFGPLGRLRSGCSNTSQMFLTADGVFGLDFWLSWEVKPESNLRRDP